jgi:YspA, cpYpsA-related SLOG family
MRVLVTGGRELCDSALVDASLSAWHKEKPITVLIHGAARGADSLCAAWAIAHGVEVESYPVSRGDWKQHGKVAGHLRNSLMLTKQPGVLLAFPGGRGIENMIQQARVAGLPIVFYGLSTPEKPRPKLF